MDYYFKDCIKSEQHKEKSSNIFIKKLNRIIFFQQKQSEHIFHFLFFNFICSPKH